MQRFVVLEKHVGQTPLQCLETWRATQPQLANTPLAYAGRLDPMASGKLLILIGEECKQQQKYHGLDKEYEFQVLFGVKSDTGDVLGLVKATDAPQVSEADLRRVCHTLPGSISLPYPHFSSKTVAGKPLHAWTLEGRLNEITIPTYAATIYQLQLLTLETKSADEIYQEVSHKIETIPPVTEVSKALGNDFRRPDVRASWKAFIDSQRKNHFQIATFRCVASSGTYMRTLADVIAKELNTTGLAYAIHRTTIGRYQSLPFELGFWSKHF